MKQIKIKTRDDGVLYVDNQTHQDTMTVRELIAVLRKFDLDARVITEGCDCIGEAIGVSKLDKSVLICRRS